MAGSICSIDAVDCTILALVHYAFRDRTLDELKRITNASRVPIDVRGFLMSKRRKKREFNIEH